MMLGSKRLSMFSTNSLLVLKSIKYLCTYVMRMRVTRYPLAHAHFNCASIPAVFIMANETTIEVELWLRALHGVLGSTLFLCNTICSCTVILTISFNKKLHYPSMVMYLGLVIADLILSAIWLVQVIAYLIAGRWQLGQGGCIHFGMILVWMLYVRWCEIAAFTLDQFLAAMLPFAKYKKFHKRFLVAATILAWVVPALLVLPSVFGFGKLSFRPQLSACTVYCEQNYSCVGYYTMLFFIFQIIGAVLPLILYITLYRITRRKRRKQNNCTLGTNAAIQVSSINTPRITQLRTVTRTVINHDHQVMTSVTAKIPAQVKHANFVKNRSTDVTESLNSSPYLPNWHGQRQERNSSITTSFSIFVTMILTHIPIYCTTALEHFGNIYVSIPIVVHLSAVYVFLFGVLVNSIIIMRSKDFREALVSLTRKYTGRDDECARSEVSSSSTVSAEGTGVHRNGEEANSQE